MKNYYYLHLDEVDSTNSYLKRNYQKLPNFTVLSASSQVKGKGRLGRIWENIPNKNLMFSILIKNDFLAIEKYSQLVGASLFLALKEIGLQSKIKWPNDILINDKKIAGILCEAISVEEKVECIVIGIGLNVNTKGFPKELKNKATSLYLQTSIKYDLDEVLKIIIKHFDDLYQKALFDNNDYLDICKKNSYLLNKEIFFRYNGKEQKGIVIDLLENGNLYVKVEEEYIQLCSGEVSLEKNYIYKNY